MEYVNKLKQVPYLNKLFTPYGLMILGIVLILLYFVSMKKKEGFADKQTTPTSVKDYKFVMYYANWCPHCKTAIPEWNGMGATQTIGGQKVQIEKYDCAVEGKEICKAKNIEGYPTFHLYGPGEKLISEMDGEFSRDQGGFLQFLKSKVV